MKLLLDESHDAVTIRFDTEMAAVLGRGVREFLAGALVGLRGALAPPPPPAPPVFPMTMTVRIRGRSYRARFQRIGRDGAPILRVLGRRPRRRR